MAQSTIIFSYNWQPEQTDCRECSICGDIIVSDMFRLIIIAKGEPKISVSQANDPKTLKVNININQRKTQTNVILCSSCHEIVEKT